MLRLAVGGALLMVGTAFAPLPIRLPPNVFAAALDQPSPTPGAPTLRESAARKRAEASPSPAAPAAVPTATPTSTPGAATVAAAEKHPPTAAPPATTPAPHATARVEELPPDRDETAVLAESGPPTEAAAPDRDGKPTAAPLVEPTPSPRPTRPPLAGRTPDGLALHVERYVPIIVWAAAAEGVDPAVIAALMDVEGSGEDAVSHAGAVGLMQLMPDKLIEGDDPFDPATNVLRAAQLIRRLARSWNGDLAAMAGAYFGAVDGQGQITNDTDGNLNGVEYVTRFARAYERWAVALGQPVREVAIRPSIRPRPTAVSTIEPELSAVPEIDDGPERDRWYLHGEPPEPAIPPVYS